MKNFIKYFIVLNKFVRGLELYFSSRGIFPDFKHFRANYICNIKDIIGTCQCDLSNVIYFIYACLVL